MAAPIIGSESLKNAIAICNSSIRRMGGFHKMYSDSRVSETTGTEKRRRKWYCCASDVKAEAVNSALIEAKLPYRVRSQKNRHGMTDLILEHA